MDMLRDLPPKHDPKGGSPRAPTPMPIPARQYQDIEYHGHTANGTIWKVATSGIAGLFVGMTVAWFTALQAKGVSRMEMEDYVSRYSPYSQDQKLIADHNSKQETKMGQLEGKQELIQERQTRSEEKHVVYESQFIELDRKLKLITDYIEAQKVKR